MAITERTEDGGSLTITVTGDNGYKSKTETYLTGDEDVLFIADLIQGAATFRHLRLRDDPIPEENKLCLTIEWRGQKMAIADVNPVVAFKASPEKWRASVQQLIDLTHIRAERDPRSQGYTTVAL